MKRWTVQYVYMDAKGETRISIDHLSANTKEEARNKAAETSPAKDFMLTVQEESDDQTLGSVRRDALNKTRETKQLADILDPDKEA